MSSDEKITIDPAICNGRPVIRGKRITVQTILEFLAAGETEENILNQYPSLEAADIKAVLSFAAKTMDHNYSVKSIV
jgi:uncharacterized protein (DUF433 family)